MSVTDKIDVHALFDLAPEKAIDYLNSKGLHVGWNWQDTLDDAHARSFTIAKMTQLDLLSDTRKAIVQAMSDGVGFKGFAESITPVMEAKGWWGQKTVTNPSGDVQDVQLGSPRRLSTIYHVNRRTAVMAAKYERLVEAADTHPYWQYSAVMDGKTRQTHAMMNGATYAIDDPFWTHNFPPNGFNCRCTVKPLTASRAEKAGVSKSNHQSFVQNIGLDRSSGEVYQATRHGTNIPQTNAQAGLRFGKSVHQTHNTVFAADAGFNSSPAAGHLMDQLWLEKARDALGDKAALEAIAKDMASEARVRGFMAWMRTTSGNGYSQNRTYGVGVLSNKAIEKFASILGTEEMGSPVVAFQDHLIAGKKARRHETAGNSLNYAAYEQVIKQFGKPDYELWDVDNQHILHIYKVDNGQAIKLAIRMSKAGAVVESSFYVPMMTVDGAIKGGLMRHLQ